jgi:hypothetical protein
MKTVKLGLIVLILVSVIKEMVKSAGIYKHTKKATNMPLVFWPVFLHPNAVKFVGTMRQTIID